MLRLVGYSKALGGCHPGFTARWVPGMVQGLTTRGQEARHYGLILGQARPGHSGAGFQGNAVWYACTGDSLAGAGSSGEGKAMEIPTNSASGWTMQTQDPAAVRRGRSSTSNSTSIVIETDP